MRFIYIHLISLCFMLSGASLLNAEEVYRKDFLDLFNVKIEWIPRDDTKDALEKNYEQQRQKLDFVVTVTILKRDLRSSETEIEVIASVKNDWVSEILGKKTRGSHVERYQKGVYFILDTSEARVIRKTLSIGEFHRDASYAFEGGGGKRSFQKELVDVDVNVKFFRALENR